MPARSWPIYPLILALLAGCTPTSVKPIPNLPTAARTIVIVPSVPPYLILATQSLLGGHVETPSIRRWDLDNLVYRSAKSVLSSTFSVSEAIRSTQIFDTQSRLDAAINDDVVAEKVIQLIKTPTRPDLYIVFCVSDRSHPYVNSHVPGFMDDIGVSTMTGPFGPLTPLLHTFLEMSVIDGKTMKLISDTPILVHPVSERAIRLLRINFENPYPYIPLHHFKWHERWSRMSLDQRTLIRHDVERLLVKAVTYTVKKSLSPKLQH